MKMNLWSGRSAPVCPRLFFFLLVAGCVSLERAPAETGAPAGGAVAVEPPVTRSKDESVTKIPAEVPACPAPAEQVRKKESSTQAPAKQAAPPLDLKSLEKRLRETEAIGVFTKLAVKNQVDDLLDELRAFHQGQPKPTLAELRRPYDLLLLKVLALVQDGDPSLARAIVASREAIWSILADRSKFNSLS